MDIYECIKPVVYGRRNFTPDAENERDRIIKLPVNTPIDKIIQTHFKRKGSRGPVQAEATAKDKEEVVKSLDTASPESVAEEAKKEVIEETLETLEKKFEDNGFHFDKRWNFDSAKEEFEIALLIKKEENSNGE